MRFIISILGHEVLLTDVHYSAGRPAKLYGDDCHPEEPDEIEYIIDTGNDLLDELLDRHYSDEINEIALEAYQEIQCGYREEEGDRKAAIRRDESIL